jgi:GDP-L-fucose synthase
MNTYKILVTGGNGLLGSALKYETKNANAEWIFVDSTDVNLLNLSEVQTIFLENNPTHVVHLAGIVGGLIFNMENNLDLFRLNHQINDNVLKAAADSKSVKKVISCLSTCIFPSEDINYPINEQSLHKGLPHDSNIGYSYSKRIIDVLNRCYMKKYPDKLFTSIIPCNIFGPHDNFNIHEGHFIPAFMHKAHLAKQNKDKEITILGSGTPLRQFIFSHDVARIITWLVENYEEKEPLIIAPNKEHSISDAVNIILKTLQFKPILKFSYTVKDTPSKDLDGQVLKTADNSKLMKYLDNIPDFSFTSFEDALYITYKWFQINYDKCRKTPSKRITLPKSNLLIKMLCGWCSSQTLIELWDKLGHGNKSFTRDGITLTMVDDSYKDDDVDHIVVVNNSYHKPSVANLKKTIFLKMEPTFLDGFWEYVHNNPELLKARFTHLPNSFNNYEWHLSKTLTQLLDEGPVPKHYDKEISAILSNKYTDSGQITRINFALQAQHQLPWHSYGAYKPEWINYKGSLPHHKKDYGLFPYKYTFNVENNKLPGYHSEKIIDAILAETLCFYSGHEDIQKHIDPRAYVLLDFDNVEESIAVMKEAIETDLWSQRVKYIRQAKKKILEETSFFPRLHRTIVN